MEERWGWWRFPGDFCQSDPRFPRASMEQKGKQFRGKNIDEEKKTKKKRKKETKKGKEKETKKVRGSSRRHCVISVKFVRS